MPSRVLGNVTREDEASVSLRPLNNPRNWTSIELGRQQIVAAPAKRVPTASLASPVHHFVNGSYPVNPTTPGGLRTPRPSPSPSALRPSSVPLGSVTGSYFLPQLGASGIEARSPANKRAPASRSSHGIETSNGPPPALSTQRSYSTEDAWRYPPPIDQLTLRPQLTHRALQGLAARGASRTNSSVDSVVRLAGVASDKNIQNKPLGSRSDTRRDLAMVQSDMSTETSRTTNDQYHSEGDQDRTIRISESIAAAADEERQVLREGNRERFSQEDLFLDLAHTDISMQELTGTCSQGEGRRVSKPFSRIALSSQPHYLPHAYPLSSTPTARPPSSDRAVIDQEAPPRANGGAPQWYQLGQSEYMDPQTANPQQPPRVRAYAASAHPLDHRTRSRVTSIAPKASFSGSRGVLRREMSPESDPAANHHRRQSVPEDAHAVPRAYKQSNLSYSTTGFYNSSPLTGRSATLQEQESSPETPHGEGTESTASITAPSTVWDELDDLKSRIRKLELTGKLPSSSAAAISHAAGERPHTATTTATTISSSPKRGGLLDNLSPDHSTIGGVHPILHTALAKARPFMKQNIYKALEATASDALILATMTASESPQGAFHGTDSVVGGSNPMGRQLRRKADSMCRSLTELCIALSEDPKLSSEATTATVRPGSRDALMDRQQHERSIEERRISRETSREPEVRSGSRLMSRLEARRTSMMGLSSFNSDGLRRSPEDVVTPTPTAFATTSRLEGNSSVLRSRRTHEEDDTTTRPLSRAMTEIRSSHRNRAAREYTSQHPLPSLHQRAPSVQSSLPVRKSYFPAAPSTPVVQAGQRRYLERSTPSSVDSARLAEPRQQRLASLGEYGTAQHGTVGRQRAEGFGTLDRMTRNSQQADTDPLPQEPDFG